MQVRGEAFAAPRHAGMRKNACSWSPFMVPLSRPWILPALRRTQPGRPRREILSGRGPIEDTALYIHQPVHRLAPAARCVLHTHMPYATALSMLENPRLEMAVQSALGFHDDIAYDPDYNGLAYDATEGERLARVLGTKNVLLMGNHGALVVGETIAVAFERLYFLERAAQAQVLALSTGRGLKLIPESVVRKTAAQFSSGCQVGGRDRPDLHFEALKRMLDRKQADYVS